MLAKILIIENEPSLAEKIVRNLKQFNYEVLPVVFRGEDAIRSIELDKPDLVILDLQFAGDMSGPSLAELIHQRFGTPVVLVVESSENLSLDTVQSINPYGFVLKDFDNYRFSVVISIALQKFQTEKRLRESEERLKTIANFTYNWEYWSDENGKFVYISPSVERVTGYSINEFMKNPGLLQEMVHPLDKQLSYDHSKIRKSTLGVVQFKLRIIKKDGTVRWLEHICQPVLDNTGVYRGHYATNYDITEQHLAETTLIESEKRYRSLFEDSSISLWEEDFSGIKQYLDSLRARGIEDIRNYLLSHPEIVDECVSKARILDVNKAAQALYKMPDKSSLINNAFRIFSMADPILIVDEIMAIANDADAYDGEGTNYDLDGNPIDVQLHWSITQEEKDRYSRVLVSIIDMTARRKRERSLEVISAVSAAVRTAKTRVEMMDVISDQITRLFNADAWAAVLITDDKKYYVVDYATGLWEKLTGITLDADDPIYTTFFPDAMPVIVNRDDHISTRVNLEDDFAYIDRVVCPLIAEDQVLGAMLIGRKTSLVDIDIDLVHSLSNIFAVALYRTNLLEKTRLYADHMTAISTLGRRLSQTLNLEEVYDYLAKGVLQIFPTIKSVYVTSFDSVTQYQTCEYAIVNNKKLDVSTYPPVQLAPPGMGTISEVAYTRQPLIVDEFSEYIRGLMRKHNPNMNMDDIQSSVIIPLIVKDEFLGVLQVLSDKPHYFTQMDVDLLFPLASTGAIAIKNSRLFTETQEQLKRLATLHTVDTAISSSLELKVTLNILANELAAIPGFLAINVLLYDTTRQLLEFSVSRGFAISGENPTSIRLGEGLAGKAALEGKVITCHDIDKECVSIIKPGELVKDEFRGYAAVPMINKGQIKGVLEVYFADRKYQEDEWIEFLETLAGQVSIAIDNNLLVQQLQRSNLELTLAYDSTLEGWSKALDLRDRETEGHSRRVTELTVRLAEALGLMDQDLVNIRRGSLLHDIGKMGIPDSILLKEGPLTPEEWVIMRKHPVYAFEMLSPITYLSKSLDIPYCHHEHWDGRGYPRGLKEEQIPLAARIFAIADVYDSLVSDRPYRKAWTKEKALQQIREESGTHLDSRIVDVFLHMMGQ